MSDLDPAIMDQFYMKDGVSASDVTRVSRTQGMPVAWSHVASSTVCLTALWLLLSDEWNS